MRYPLLSLLLYSSCTYAQSAGLAVSLDRVAHIASVMIDGDLCRRIETPRSREFAMKKDERDPWGAADNFDVNDEAFNRTKKTLMRLAKLCDGACDLNLWMPLGSDRNRVQVLVRNVHEMSQFWPWGALNQEMPDEMKRVFDTGRRLEVHRKPGMVSVLAPVYDSLGDIAALVEVVSQDRPDPRENVK